MCERSLQPRLNFLSDLPKGILYFHGIQDFPVLRFERTGNPDGMDASIGICAGNGSPCHRAHCFADSRPRSVIRSFSQGVFDGDQKMIGQDGYEQMPLRSIILLVMNGSNSAIRLEASKRP